MNDMHWVFKRWKMISGLFILSFFIFILICNSWVENSTGAQMYDTVKGIPKRDVALILGTAKYTKNGYLNPYFDYRIKAAVQLYKSGKVKHLLVSGDNSLKNYNEPKQMKEALIKQGVPETAITLDYAGFRTLDSVVRSKLVFGQQRITIVSQKFHNHRALFIANHRKVEAIAFNAEDVGFQAGIKTRLREYLARCKAVLDIILLNKQPRFLGENITIKINK